MDTLTDYLIAFGQRPDEAVAYLHEETPIVEPLSMLTGRDVSRIQAAVSSAWNGLIEQGVEVMPPSPEDEDEEEDD